MADTPIRELSIRFDAAVRAVEAETAEKVAQIAGNDLVALITRRVLRSGQDSNGGSFTPYSKRPMTAAKLKGKSRTASAERVVSALASKGGALSYEEFRRINGLNTDKKIFEFTGEMWRKFGVTSILKSGDRFTVVLGGTTREAARKIAGNSKREGKLIIDASKKELSLALTLLYDWYDSLFNDLQ